VTTVEGIGSVKKGLHPVQTAIVEHHGTQCGFCTPGMVKTPRLYYIPFNLLCEFLFFVVVYWLVYLSAKNRLFSS
jgi:hypothetical protein